MSATPQMEYMVFNFSEDDILESVACEIQQEMESRSPALSPQSQLSYPGYDFPDDISECDSILSFQSQMTYLSDYCNSDDFWYESELSQRHEYLNTVFTIDHGEWICEGRMIVVPPQKIEEIEPLKCSYIITNNNWFCNKEI